MLAALVFEEDISTQVTRYWMRPATASASASISPDDGEPHVSRPKWNQPATLLGQEAEADHVPYPRFRQVLRS